MTSIGVPIGQISRLVDRSIDNRNDLPVFSISKHDGFVRSDQYFKKKVHSEDTSNYRVVQSGDFAFSPIHLDEGAIALAYDAGLISPMYRVFEVDRSRCDINYLIRILKSHRLVSLYDRLGDGSVHRRRSVSFDRFAEIRIPLPPLKEQRRIAELINRVDSLRHKHKLTIELLERLTQSIFLEMFGDPVSNPKGLPLTTLGAVGKLDRGVSKHRPRNDPALLGGPYPLIQTGDVASSLGYIRNYRSTYSETGLKQSKIWPVGTLCITIAANIAQTGILTFEACFPDSVVGFVHPNPAMVQFVRVWLSFLRTTLERTAPAVAQKNINLQVLRNLTIALPSNELINSFGKILEARLRAANNLRSAAEKAEILFSSVQHHSLGQDIGA